ncbi:MAG: DNA gyrase C-terminal beta-propeller domain-containing protein, partial [Bradymonadaceae bacterium]
MNLIEYILELAADDDRWKELLETNVMMTNEEIYSAAEEEFGGWDGALIAALRQAVTKSSTRAPSRRPQPSQVERRVTEAFEHPIYAMSSGGRFYAMHGPDLEVTDEPQIIESSEDVGYIKGVRYIGDADAVFLFSTKGRFFSMDQRMVPLWVRREDRRSIRDVLYLEGGEEIFDVLPRRAVMSGRVIHITAGGKGKATDSSEFGSNLDRSGREAFLLGDDDLPIAALAGPARDTSIFCASAMGQGIHFDAADLRSMGRKAVGVNVMKLADDNDAVISACLGKNVHQLAIITAEGLGKRVDFDDFRIQGRAGAGMQLARINSGDRLVAAVDCNPGGDLVLTTTHGRIQRIPATNLLLMGRPAKG